jgi:hypothetical protein
MMLRALIPLPLSPGTILAQSMADGPIVEDEEERRRLRAEARKDRRAEVEKKVCVCVCRERHVRGSAAIVRPP